jgi:hypothetical protein
MFKTLRTVLCGLLVSGTAHAADPVQLEDLNRSANRAVNVVTLFTSQDNLSSGVFNFDGSNGRDTDFRVTRLPYTYVFEPISDGMVPEATVVYGFSKVTQSIAPVEGAGQDDFSRLSTNSLGLGTGLKVPAMLEGFSMTPRFFFAWAHLKRKYDFNNPYSQENLQPLDRDIYNTSGEVLIYTPSLQLMYEFQALGGSASIHTRYSHLFNESLNGKSEIIDISSDTGLLQSEIEGLFPSGYDLLERQIQVHPFVVRSDVYGDARSGLGFSYFHEVGIDLVFSHPTDQSLLKDISIGCSYTFGDDFDGWRLGIGLGI